MLWRDQFRYFALMTSKQRLSRKKKAQKAIQAPYLCTPEGKSFAENYLLKMRHDTKFLSESTIIQRNFNVVQQGSSDPFLTQMSIQGKVVVGDLRALKQQKSNMTAKRVLHFGQDETYKARSCEEMLMFEKQEQHDKSMPAYAC